MIHIVVAFALAPLRGWAVATVWGWYVVPLGAPALHPIVALGLVVLVQLLHPRGRPTQAEIDEALRSFWPRMRWAVIDCLVGVGVAWLWLQVLGLVQ